MSHAEAAGWTGGLCASHTGVRPDHRTTRFGLTAQGGTPYGAARREGSRELQGKEVNQSMTLFNALISLVDHDEEGQGLAEYALILALIAIVAIVALIFLGTQVSTIMSTVGASI
jgi:pilus assembly protein Flp/PilA